MTIVIKEIRVRTVVEKHVVTGSEIPEEVIREIGDKVAERLAASEGDRSSSRHWARRRTER